MSYIQSYKILDKTPLNHNTYKITVKINEGKIPNLITSSFVYIYTDDCSSKRPYTPIEVISEENIMIFAIKIYKIGILSNFLNKKSVGDEIMISKPSIKLKYNMDMFQDILMIAGGTGITPMLQILNEAVKNKEKTHFTLIFCNLSIKDIFLKELLDKFEIPLKIIHVIEKVEDKEEIKDLNNNSQLISGRINTKILKDECVLEHDLLYDFVYVCGPPSMMEAVCGPKDINKDQGPLRGMLYEIGFKDFQVYKF